ncbi:proline racemase family protein [Streptomyces sp. MUM 178J]|uniref:proline racemase family protein n=1 Tax=Streptomyces sp. MUM 178J TaxID=2791991 RepID=UPI001F03A945|nr:proline racemase family protein [Streptomyces sp. MUM 178J]WRQ80666.1 proline racemase family protein [Streptomyces sp. MUM 178J]
MRRPAAEFRTTDYHTAGEPFRIVADTAPPLPGSTVAARRAALVRAVAAGSSEQDAARRLLVREPRGHAGMYGGFVVPPDDAGADFGVVFWHKDGYSTACGHGTMALGVWAVESGRVRVPQDGEAPVAVRIDVPSGRVAALVRRRAGRVAEVTFRNVPAVVSAAALPVATRSFGTVEAGVAHAGACYVSVAAQALGLDVSRQALPRLTAAAREIRTALADHAAVRHPGDPLLSGVYGVMFHEELPDTPAGPRQRSATVFADGQVDRSPCGSGTSARLALLAESGRMGDGDVLRHESVVGSVFTASLAGRAPGGVLTEITGTSHRTGEHLFTLEEDDTLGTGFLL